ncbi:uncharacterized protein LOC121946368 [Plectropomus leopardus]|uniref:uncharacterized protein LOC121946368 n=1 Tax=Plectropomus leopardus TaxID=160734 RepID=UPI001C4CF380|nr:uncharacterized protein LOC121946368 [Plectropomus leopardus]
MAQFNPQGLLLLVVLVVKSECIDNSPVTEYVSASQEENVVLPCFDSYVMDPKNCQRVKLIKYATDASQEKVIFARPKTPKFQDAKRVKLEADRNGQMSLILTKSQKSDEGLYRCEIWQGWICVLVRNISVKVKDCSKHPPVKAVPGTPVTLNCPVNITSGQQGPQNITWALEKGGNPVSVSSNRVVINGTSLAVQSVDYSDSGWYRCTYKLGQTQRCFIINLLLQEEENVVMTTAAPALTTSEIISEAPEERRSGTFTAVVASVITGTVIMAALIGLFIYRRCNNHRVTQHTQRSPAVSTPGYEFVNLTLSQDDTTRVNSIYQHIPDEGLCTFQC